MKSNWLILIIVLINAFPSNILCQEGFNISIPRLELSNDNLIIEYDIRNTDPGSLFIVWIEVTDASGNKINAVSLTGDVGDEITGGLNKRIIWNLRNDKTLLDEEIFVEVKAEKKETTKDIKSDIVRERKIITRGNMIISSVILPGWGQSKVNKGKPYWLLGVVGYGCVAGSVYLNRQGSTTYDDYKISNDIIASNSLYNKAVKQDQYSTILAYSALGIWTANIIWALVMPNNLMESSVSLHKEKIKIGPYFDVHSKTTMLSFHYRF